MGVLDYNTFVEADHLGLTSHSQVITQVQQWLGSPLPRGAAHRAGFDPLPPPSHQNAYVGSRVGPDGYSVGGGLRREAIVKLEVDPADPSAWYGAQGALIPAALSGLGSVRLTGMAPLSTIGLLQARIYSDQPLSAFGWDTDLTLDELGTLLPQDVLLPAGIVTTPPNVWVPFMIDVGQVGRDPVNQYQIIVGPDGTSPLDEYQFVGYELRFPEYSQLGSLKSPPTRIRLPE